MHSRTTQTPFITLRGYYRDVIEKQANFLINAKATAATKVIILHIQCNIAYAIRTFRKGLT